MLTLDDDLIVMTVPHYGQIGAGTVVPFPSARQPQTIIIPAWLEHCEPFCLEVSGDSFEPEDLFDGARLICRRRFESSEVTTGRLCVVSIDSNEQILKRVYYLDDGRVRLTCPNPKYDDLILPAELVAIDGLVEGEWTPRR